jgi:hypothetical protein
MGDFRAIDEEIAPGQITKMRVQREDGSSAYKGKGHVSPEAEFPQYRLLRNCALLSLRTPNLMLRCGAQLS